MFFPFASEYPPSSTMARFIIYLGRTAYVSYPNNPQPCCTASHRLPWSLTEPIESLGARSYSLGKDLTPSKSKAEIWLLSRRSAKGAKPRRASNRELASHISLLPSLVYNKISLSHICPSIHRWKEIGIHAELRRLQVVLMDMHGYEYYIHMTTDDF